MKLEEKNQLPEFPYSHVFGGDQILGDDSGPDCPYCGPVSWPCGDHEHYGVKWLTEEEKFSAPHYYPNNIPEEGSGYWDFPVDHVVVECPKCKRRWRFVYE